MTTRSTSPLSESTQDLVRCRLINRDAIDLALDRLKQGDGRQVLSWFVDPEGGDRGAVLERRAPYLDALLVPGRRTVRCSLGMLYSILWAAPAHRAYQGCYRDLVGPAATCFGYGLCVAAEILRHSSTDPLQIPSLGVSAFLDHLATAPFDDPKLWRPTAVRISGVVQLEREFAELAREDVMAQLVITVAVHSQRTRRPFASERFFFFVGCAVAGIRFSTLGSEAGQ